MGRAKKAAVGLLLAGHGAMVIAGVFQVVPFRDRAFGQLFTTLSIVTGTQTNFSFFAPGVGSQLKVTFRVHLPLETKEEVFAIGTREAELRIGNMIDTFWGRRVNEEVKQSVAASWAAKVFGDHPDAKAVEVFVDAFELPSMVEYKDGKLPRWDRFYTATFKKAGGDVAIPL